MKEGWEYKKLGEVCMHKNKILRAAKHYASNEQINYIDISSIDNSQNIILSTTPYVFSDAPSRAQQIVEKGDVLVSLVRPNLKNIAIVNIDNNRLVASSGFCVLRAETNINNRYIFYIVRGNAFTKYLLGRVQGANYPAVREDDVKSYSIPIPPLAEQERIVAELDLLSSIIDKKKAQLKELDQLAQSIFYDMFGDPITNEKGWEVKKLSDICEKITDGTHDTPKRLDVGVKFITGKHIRPFFIDYDNSDYVAEEVHNEIYKRCNPEYGDVLYTNIGAGIGNAALNVVEYEFSMKNVALLKLKKNSIIGYFVVHFLNDDKMKSNIIENHSNGGAQRFLSLKAISKIRIIIPPLPLQQEFASKVEAIERQKTLIQQSIVETQTLFDSRMDYWFD